MKIPKMLMRPVMDWTEAYGMRRAIKVIDLQASRLRGAGDNRSAHELRTVSKALKAALNKGAPVPESVSLGWCSEDQGPV